MKRESRGVLLLGTYFLVATLCVALNYSDFANRDITTIVVNATMFLIVAIILGFTYKHYLSIVNAMGKSFEKATNFINNAYKEKNIICIMNMLMA